MSKLNVINYKVFLFIVFASLILLPETILSQKLAVFPELTEPRGIQIDENQIYIFEKSKVYIYSRDDFNLVKMFGKEGKGPGEFDLGTKRYGVNLHIDILSAYILAHHMEKLSFFSKNGEFQKQINTPPQTSRLYPVGARFIGTYNYLENDHFGSTDSIHLFDKNITYIKEIHRSQPGGGRVTSLSEGKVKEVSLIRDFYGFQVDKDRIYVGESAKGLHFTVFDAEGKELYKIDKDYESIPVKAEYKKERLHEFQKSFYWKNFKRLMKISFPENFPAFQNFLVSDGKIYIFTYKREYKMHELVITDLEGTILNQIFVPDADYYDIFRDIYFYLVETDDEEWELHYSNLGPLHKESGK